MIPHVQILDTCPHCQGTGYLNGGEHGSPAFVRTRHSVPCPVCKGDGEFKVWVNLPRFATMLKTIKCPHKHTSFEGGYHSSNGDVWDDIVEVCDDCGAILDK